MNLEIANRLVEYRKKAGYSQEELADKLGISRQAVSKWERVEASPDTDNLIALANLYNVSLDELINGKKPEEKTSQSVEAEQEVVDDNFSIGSDGIHAESKDGEEVHIDKTGIHIKTKNGKERHFTKEEAKERMKNHRHPLVGVLYPVFSLLTIIAYFILGSFKYSWSNITNGYAIWWVLFIFIPVIPSFVDAIINRRLGRFNIPCLITSAFCFLGITFTWWHPGWLLFLLIPIYYTIVKPIDRVLAKKYPNVWAEEDEDFDEDEDD